MALMFIMVIETGKKMKSSTKAIIIPSLKGAIYIISEKRPESTHTQHTLSGNSNAARNM